MIKTEWLSNEEAQQVGSDRERERIIELLKQEFGEDYYDMGVVGQIVRLIKTEIEPVEIPQFEGTRNQLNFLTVKRN
jgi:hypothetical protein